MRYPTLAILLPLILAACGGAGASLAPTAAPTGSQGPTSAPTDGPTAAPTDAPTTGPGIADACTLLTPEEVSAAYGTTLDTAEPNSDELYVYCTYTGEGEVDTYVTKSAATATIVFDTMKVNDGEAVSGVGDEAFWSTDSFRPGLYFLKGGLLAYISGAQTGPEDPIVQLGVLLASRM